MTSQFSFNPYSADFSRDPYSVYAHMRAACPIYYHEDWKSWILSAYGDIKALIGDERLGRTMDHVLNEEEICEYRRQQNWDAAPNHSKYVKISILDSEAELHDRLRRAVFKIFTVSRVKELRGFVQNLVDRQLDYVEQSKQFDFIEDFVAPIPGYVIGEMLGVPEQNRAQLRIWSEDIVQFFEPERTDAHRDLAEQATLEFVAFLQELVEQRKRKPEKDLLSEMLMWRDTDGKGLSHEEFMSTAMTILMAGHGSTIDASGNGMLALLQHPEQMTMLKSDPSLIDTAVQEMFRYDPPLPLFFRFALCDMEYKGIELKKGTKLGFLYASANRDEAQFEQADKFDIKRMPNRHLAFGGGIHHCLGNHLARQNMDIMFNTLLRRMPRIKLAVDDDKLEHRPGIQSRGLKTLPVTF